MKEKILSKKCEICGKEIISISQTQLDWNYDTHVRSHDKKEDEKDG